MILTLIGLTILLRFGDSTDSTTVGMGVLVALVVSLAFLIGQIIPSSKEEILLAEGKIKIEQEHIKAGKMKCHYYPVDTGSGAETTYTDPETCLKLQKMRLFETAEHSEEMGQIVKQIIQRNSGAHIPCRYILYDKDPNYEIVYLKSMEECERYIKAQNDQEREYREITKQQ